MLYFKMYTLTFLYRLLYEIGKTVKLKNVLDSSTVILDLLSKLIFLVTEKRKTYHPQNHLKVKMSSMQTKHRLDLVNDNPRRRWKFC